MSGVGQDTVALKGEGVPQRREGPTDRDRTNDRQGRKRSVTEQGGGPPGGVTDSVEGFRVVSGETVTVPVTPSPKVPGKDLRVRRRGRQRGNG